MKPASRPKKRHPLFYLLDLYFLHIVALAWATPWLRRQIYMGDVPQPHFPECTARQVDLHWGFRKGRIGCSDDYQWGWLVEYVGNALGTDNPSAFFDSSDLFYVLLVFYACGHVLYAVIRLIRIAVRRLRRPAPPVS